MVQGKQALAANAHATHIWSHVCRPGWQDGARQAGPGSKRTCNTHLITCVQTGLTGWCKASKPRQHLCMIPWTKLHAHKTTKCRRRT